MKVLQISNYFYPNIGGIEQVARDIANALSEEDGIEQKIICFNETAHAGPYRCKRAETVHEIVDGVEVIRCGCITKKASQSISLTFGRELKKVMAGFQPDVVIFHYPNPFQTVFLRRYLKKNIKLIVYWHLDIVKQKTLRKLFYGQTIRLLERADRVIATSPLYIDGSSFLRRYRYKCQVIPNCICESRLVVTQEIQDRAEQIRAENAGKVICFGVGRHIPYKGFEYLIRASECLDDRFRIFIGGKGELSDALKAQAAGDDKIVFLGRVSEEELIAYYIAMDIFCFPSITKNEAFGIALAEALYFGKPAVTFMIPGSGVNYVNLSGVTGIEVPNRDVATYANALKKLAEHPELREKLGNAGRKRAEDLFSSERFAENITGLIESVRNMPVSV